MVTAQSFLASRLCAGPLWTRLLAVIGILLLIERSATYYHWRFHPTSERTFSAATNLGLPSSTTLHKAPSNQTDVRKALVVASVQGENTTWIDEHFPDWERNIYIVNDAKATHSVLITFGREASVYLTYLINNYANLPDYIVFIHAKRHQWHNDSPMYDGVPPIQNLQLPSVTKNGYVSLRCHHNPGCSDGVTPNPAGPDSFFQKEHLLAQKIFDFFPERFPDPGMPGLVAAPCCAQFAVSKAQVLQRTPLYYERIRDWLWHGGEQTAKSGAVMEYLWHMIFGKPPIYCQHAKECYCENFGLCDLKCGERGRCEGRVKDVMPYVGLPEGWPAVGQDQEHLPRDKWWEEIYPPSEYDGFKLRANLSREKGP